MPVLQEQIDASAYLSGLCIKYPSLTPALAESAFEDLQNTYNGLASINLANGYRSIEQQLIQSKARFAFVWSLAELSGVGTFAERGQWQTRFAELTIDIALQVAWMEIAAKHKAVQKSLSEHPDGMPGMFIFGMGKLGGGDLNFSSDVDLVAYFDSSLLPVPEMLGKSYICHLVLQKLTKLLSQNGSAEFIWRVDWRLRPNASAATFALSTTAAEEYYFFRASPWHRLALLKARVVAGDRVAGQAFLNSITPFIWRQNLDFRALDELAEIKSRINLEHPALRTQRGWREPISDEIGGFNLKLGTGGIREIEFIANALQLVWGGKYYSLRTPNTLQAIDALEKLGQLDSHLARELIESYQNLRRIENAIQILSNHQTHLIPSEIATQQKLMKLLAEDDWKDFVIGLNQHRASVSKYFEDLFADQTTPQGAGLMWPKNISSAAAQVVAGWDRGFIQYGVSPQKRNRLRSLANALADYLAGLNKTDSFDASNTVLRLNDFFRSLPLGEQYFRLLAESPRLLESIIPPLLFSPAMGVLLKQSPHIIDCYMGSELDLKYGFDSAYVLQAEQYEIRLERMRRFVNEHLYQLYLMFLQGELTVNAFQAALSTLAEHTLELALKIVAENMNLAASPITVLGMGKVALRRMSPLSDLDLIFIFDPQKTSIELALKFVARLQTAISTRMREGIVYELDTRLRPSGQSGAPTVSIDSFATHQTQRAHTWEHIALVSSRVVAGDRSLEPRIQKIKRQVLSRRRDQQQFISDAAKMWARISVHRLKQVDSAIMFSKLRPGGLMQSEYLAACIILSHRYQSGSLEFDSLLARAIEVNTAIEEMPEILQFWRTQQLWERLLGFTEQPLDSLPEDYLQQLLAHSSVNSLAELLSRKTRYAKQIISHMESMFAELNTSGFKVDDWQETKVNWQS